MTDRIAKAAELHKKGYNCAQAVACAYCDLVDSDEKEVFRLMEGFGLGMGCMEGTCGALSGAIMLAGLKNSDGNIEDPATKAATYKISKELLQKFVGKTGSSVCKELKGVETGKVLCSCPDCIKIGVEVAQEVLGL